MNDEKNLGIMMIKAELFDLQVEIQSIKSKYEDRLKKLNQLIQQRNPDPQA